MQETVYRVIEVLCGVAYSLIQNVTGGVTVPSAENVTEGTGAGRRADDGR